MVVPLSAHRRKVDLQSGVILGAMMTEQTGKSRHLRQLLKKRRDELGWSAQRVADKVAEEIGRKSLSGESVRQWEQFISHPSIDKYAAWCRVLGMRLVMEVVDDSSDRVVALLDPQVADLARALDMASAADRTMLRQMMERMGIGL